MPIKSPEACCGGKQSCRFLFYDATMTSHGQLPAEAWSACTQECDGVKRRSNCRDVLDSRICNLNEKLQSRAYAAHEPKHSSQVSANCSPRCRPTWEGGAHGSCAAAESKLKDGGMADRSVLFRVCGTSYC